MRPLLDPESSDAVPGFPKRTRANQAQMVAELALPGDVTVCVLVFRGRSLANARDEHCGLDRARFGAAR